MEATRHSCLKLEPKDEDPIFVKATWFDSHFDLSLTDGHQAWICHASEEEVRERAAQWDQPVSEYIALAERYLGFQQPDSVYAFADAGDGHKRLSWTFEKEGTKLQWRWKCQPAPASKQTTAGILDFLMDANIRLSEEVVRKTQSFERLKVEAEKSLAQSEKISNEKIEFESALYAKFLRVLNSKKAKLRDLRDQLTKRGTAAGKLPQEEEESTDKTESFDDTDDEKSDKESSKNVTGTSRDVQTSRPHGRKRTVRN
ncbi:DNA repair protein XRCC [Trema orientale]|uniref:DNA repair protein XRCC n=1 Tax=Trema orientale TaxID=63057 RepID=A0A2P5ECP7_TREOI|nr:DNA repair protein XRCC [Trema orientale]